MWQEFDSTPDKFELAVPGRKDRIKIVRGEHKGELEQLIEIGVSARSRTGPK